MQFWIFFSRIRQYLLATSVIVAAALLCFQLSGVLGYYAVSFILLILVSILATFLKTGPVLVSSLLSLLVWNFFFIPPHNTFHIEKTEDILMFVMFGLVVIINGVFTWRVRRQEKLACKARFLDESDRLYKTLFNSVSHELRSPIATILGAADALKSSGNANKLQAALSCEIYAASLRLNRLIENLLNMSRLESGMMALRLDWYDLNDLVYKVINDLNEELRPFILKLSIPDNLPLVRIDFGLMEQVLYNLIYNCCRYSPVNSEISIQAEHISGNLVIRVLDNGPGFPPGLLEEVFNKFFRVDDKGTGGLGLGLSIVKGFVEAHQGNVLAENRPNGGAAITLTIPSELPDMTEITMENNDA